MNFLISVCSPRALPTLTQICQELDMRLPVAALARGTAVRSMLDILGIEDNERRVVFSVADTEKTREFIRQQQRRMFIGVPGHGKTVAYLNGDRQDAKYAPELNYAYELIVAIANEGRTDQVMNAARHAGARGGTVLHGKGTAGETAQKFFNVSIASEQEVVLIVAEAAQKSAIMSAILKDAGPASDAGAIVFSLPISEVAGFGLFAEA